MAGARPGHRRSGDFGGKVDNSDVKQVALITVVAVAAAASLDAQRRGARFIQRRITARATTSETITSQNRTRRYLLHIPSTLDAAQAAPLVLVYHGGSDTPEHTETMTRFSDLADREHFVVAYLEGIQKSWADGRASTPAETLGVDDVAFSRAVVADIGTRRRIEARRVYATGPSNGGIFANRLGCDAADTFAAIGPVIGGLASNLVSQCRPSAPIAVAAVQGVADQVVPFDGGAVGEDLRPAHGGRIEGSRATEAFWASANGCSATPNVTRLASRANDGTSVARREHGGCRGGVAVVWYEIEGGGHRWPPAEVGGPAERLIGRKLGVSSQNLDATSALWAFFKAHPKTDRVSR